MSTPVLDRLGHPCDWHAALERFETPMAEAAQLEKDTYFLRMLMVRRLLEVNDRINRTHDALNGVTATGIDGDEGRAMLEMLAEYSLTTTNQMWSLGGLVMALIQRLEGSAT